MAKKRKKYHANSSAAVRQRAENARIADEKDRARRRMNPVARNLLLGDLVFLAACTMLERAGMISEKLNPVTAIIGLAIIPVALYFQFIKKDGGSSKRLK